MATSTAAALNSSEPFFFKDMENKSKNKFVGKEKSRSREEWSINNTTKKGRRLESKKKIPLLILTSAFFFGGGVRPVSVLSRVLYQLKQLTRSARRQINQTKHYQTTYFFFSNVILKRNRARLLHFCVLMRAQRGKDHQFVIR